MKKSTKNKFVWALVYVLGMFYTAVSAQTGMHQDRKHAFIIPMLEKNELIGHAYVYELDKVSKDSNSYAIQVYDEYLHDVGETKFMLASGYTFDKAAFNGEHIIAKFNDKKGEQSRYCVFNQKGELIHDSTVDNHGKLAEYSDYRNLITTQMHSINRTGVLDYYQHHEHGKTVGCVRYIDMDHNIWTYQDESSTSSNINFLQANKSYTINTLYTYHNNKLGNGVKTSILGLSTPGGVRIFSTPLHSTDDICIYPISAEITPSGIEVISQFTQKQSRYGRIKYGICTHQLDLNGVILSSHFNELTQSMIEDSVAKKYKLFVYSYLYMHKAIPLKNGHWLVAAEQLRRTYNKFRFFKPGKAIYNKKSMCLLEVKTNAEVVRLHVEPNKEEGVFVPQKYVHLPQMGAFSLQARDRVDINYFIQDYSSPNDKISFVFTDVNGKAKKIALGNLFYNDGDIKVDKFNIKLFSSGTRISIQPARFGHVLLFKYDPNYGIADFDNIKFDH